MVYISHSGSVWPQRTDKGEKMVFDKEKAKEEVKKLVEKYNNLVESGKVKLYNEEMTKKDFILPLFRALGWNVEDGDEVGAEQKISRGRVDYAFRIDGIPKLFLEAKPLKADLDKTEYAEQSINYAWHKGATWAILTDFECVKVFNAERKSINPLQNMFFSLNHTQFLDQFDQLLLLSRESLENGVIDTKAEKWGKKVKKIPVDKQLLSDLTKFRELLTKNIMKNNDKKDLTGDELDEAVQRILDRLLFIRTLEDKQLEAPVLQALIRENQHKKVFKKLNNLFREIDDVYNSKLFRPHLCEELIVDDDILEIILRGLFTTADNTVHYDFGAIDADVLGNMYEQYLGHILKKTEKRAKLTNGKAHRKEQGIYYTPTYVVDYIVKNTVGELVKNKKFDLKKIKVLDPACGSGSFLMKAFDYLITLDKQKNGDIDQTKLDLTGASATYGRKVEILKNNIFGVDLDPKAVEIAQLNLLLKAAEKKHRLPTLQENIKVGNSLINNSEIAGKRAFKWEEEFKEIMGDGGFDVVIGNPPYVRNETLPKNEKVHFMTTFISAKGKFDIYLVFIEKAIRLLNEEGLLGFIVPSKFMAADYGFKLREFLLEHGKILQIIDVSQLPVFENVATYPCILIFQKTIAKNVSRHKIQIATGINSKRDLQDLRKKVVKINQSKYGQNKKKIFTLVSDVKSDEVVSKIKLATKDLQDICEIKAGIHNGNIRQKLIVDSKINNTCKRLLIGKNVGRYHFNWEDLYVRYDPKLAEKSKGEYCSLRDERIFTQKEKLLIRDIGKRLPATYDDKKNYCMDTIYVLFLKEKCKNKFNLKYVLGILNSNLIEFYFRKIFGTVHVGSNYQRYKRQFLINLPIKVVSSDKQLKIAQLVSKILTLNTELENLENKTTDEKDSLEKEVEKLDSKIDQEVYKIYNLTKNEIQIVEASLK